MDPVDIPRTFVDLLVGRLRSDPARPLLTAYDDATGERTELSVATYANWVSKTANLFTDELGLDAGDTVLVDLPPHWLVPVFAGGAWSAGLALTTDPSRPHRVAVCGPDTLAQHAGAGDADDVVACSLRPFAVRFPEPLPPGVHDHGLLWPGQSDVFAPVVPPSPDTIAWDTGEVRRSQAELLEAATAAAYAPGVRLLTDVHPLVDGGVAAFLAPLAHGGSVVLVSHPDEARWPARVREERATEELRQPPSW